ncbi:dienelactone hydrolase family protein, partial [Salmonella enterica subsp. enterica serovar Anatum]|nr:dienelactone hydrolase family protein [Salmonella enterica subsp. enterica serovar Anatum]
MSRVNACSRLTFSTQASIPSQGDDMPAYYARPKASDGALPVVIVVQEIFGVHEHIRD